MSQNNNNNDDNSRYAIRSLNRALDILTSFSADHNEFSIAELAKLLDLHKSTVHRLVTTMVDRGIMQRNQNGKYSLGLKILELGTVVLNHIDIRQQSRKFLEELSALYKETVHLVIMDKFEAIYIDKVEQPDAVVRYSHVGKRLPLYCTAVGKVLLSGLDPDELEQVVSSLDLIPRTDRTITCREKLKEAVYSVRRQGFALDDEELEYGLRCVAAPILNHQGQIVAACSISGNPGRLSDTKLNDLIADVRKTALNISTNMGYKS